MRLTRTFPSERRSTRSSTTMPRTGIPRSGNGLRSEEWVSLDMRYIVVLLVWLSGVTSSDAGTLTSKLRLAQESREQCTNRCDSGYDACIGRCPLATGRVSCTGDCQAQLSAC